MKVYHFWRSIISAAILLSAIIQFIPAAAKTSSLFEGDIAYVGVDGNVYILSHSGETLQLTDDANITNESDYSINALYYDCVYFSPDGRYLAFEAIHGDDLNYKEAFVYNLSEGRLAGRFRGVDCMGLEWLDGQHPFLVTETEYLDSNYSERVIKGYVYKFNGNRELIFEIRAFGYAAIEIDGTDTVTYYESPDEVTATIFNWVTNEKRYENRPQEQGNTELSMDLPGYSLWISDTEAIFVNLSDDFADLYYFKSPSSQPQLIYSTDKGNSINNIEYSDNNQLLFTETFGYNEDRENNFYLLNLEAPEIPTLIDVNVEGIWWTSIDSSKLYYVRFVPWANNGNGSGIDKRELILYDFQTGEKIKMLDFIPNLNAQATLASLRFMTDPIAWRYTSIPNLTATPLPSPVTPVIIDSTSNYYLLGGLGLITLCLLCLVAIILMSIIIILIRPGKSNRASIKVVR